MHPKILYVINSFFKIGIELFIWDRRLRRVLKGSFCRCLLKKYIKAVEREVGVLSDNKNNEKWRGIPPPLGGPGSFDQPNQWLPLILYVNIKRKGQDCQRFFHKYFVKYNDSW